MTGVDGKVFPGHSVPLVAMLAVEDPTRVFVGNVDPKVSDEEISKLFSSAGAIKGLTRERLVAYIEFASAAGATKALEFTRKGFPSAPDRAIRVELRRTVLGEDGLPRVAAAVGRRRVRLGKPKVFVVGFPAETAAEVLATHFGGEAAGVTSARVVADGAFVDFTSEAQATEALKLHESSLGGSVLQVSRKAPKGISRAPRKAEGAAASEEAKPKKSRPRKSGKKAAPAAAAAASTATKTRPEPVADPCSVFVTGFGSPGETQDACEALGTVERVKTLRSRTRREGDAVTVTCMVKFANTEMAAKAAAALEGRTVSVDVAGKEKGTTSGKTDSTVHAHVDDLARRKTRGGASGPASE
jgi:RNA recognition motif-containing protein